MSSIPGQEAKIPHSLWPKNKSNIITNSIETLTMVHIRKISLKNINKIRNPFNVIKSKMGNKYMLESVVI